MTGARDGLAVHRVGASEMAGRTVEVIRERLNAGAATADLAVLARVNSALLPVQVALTEAGVAHTAPLDATVLGRTGVRAALAYLRIGNDPERIRREDVLETINRPARKVRSAVQPLLGRRARFSLAQLEQIADSLSETHRDRFLDYLGDLRSLASAIADGAETARCLWSIRNRIGLGEAMDALDASRSRPEGSSHGDDLDALEQLATLHSDPAGFQGWLHDRLRQPGVAGGVTLSTVHRVKGMEWPFVVVFAANQGLFPHRLADDVEEERRVLHVALTRCQEHVTVVADRDRTSPFLAELTGPAAPVSFPVSPGVEADVGTVVVRWHGDEVVAVEGLCLGVTGGFTGRITAVAADHAEVTVSPDPAGSSASDPGGAIALRVPFGQAVTVEGRPARLTGPGRRGARAGAGTGHPQEAGGGRGAAAGQEPDVDEAVFEALRAWRARIAAELGLPAYLVFHDRHLRQIAGSRPATLRELAACPGVGPTKLERYGDDVLAVLAGTGT